MSDIFTDPGERSDLVNEVAARRGLSTWVVEKDLWVCWVLGRLREVEGLPTLIFKGGTSLSKVYGLIERFSEDIDLTISRDGWGFEGERDPFGPGLSNKKRGRLVDEIVKQSREVVRDQVLPGMRRVAESSLGPEGWSLDLDPHDPQTVLFTYPQPVGAYGYGRPEVKLEFGARGARVPVSEHRVQPFLEEEFEGFATAAVADVVTLGVERTFWEKATLLHALHHGTLAKPDKNTARLSRHLYDLHRLWNDSGVRGRVESAPLLDVVTRDKEVFFRETKARYELVGERRLSATPHTKLERHLRRDYVDMQDMFFPDTAVPEFDDLVGTTREIDALVASWPVLGAA